MAAIKQSLAWWCFGRSMSPEDLIAHSRRIGYAGVEMCPEEHWQKVIDGGLKIVTMGGHGTLTDGLNKRENHDRIEGEINANLQKAAKWGIPATGRRLRPLKSYLAPRLSIANPPIKPLAPVTRTLSFSMAQLEMFLVGEASL